jgi:hypothetical protein
LMHWFSRYVSLSLSRLWMREVAYFATRPPVTGGTSVVRIKEVAAARRNQQPLLSWGAILIKAIALVAQHFPELKRSYMPLPWPHFYQHPYCIATIVVERDWRGASAVFFDQIVAPENKSLREIDAELRGLKERPIMSVGAFRRLIRLTHLPPPLRRTVWRFGLYASGRLRSRYFGTFALNSVPARHGFTTQSMTPLSASFFYGFIGPKGDLPIQIFFDHRVMDGATAARLFSELNVVLRRDIVAELAAEGDRRG